MSEKKKHKKMAEKAAAIDRMVSSHPENEQTFPLTHRAGSAGAILLDGFFSSGEKGDHLQRKGSNGAVGPSVGKPHHRSVGKSSGKLPTCRCGNFSENLRDFVDF